MIEKAFERTARAIELALALAFIVAVGLNFVNVVGRYLFGWTILSADEVQIFIMIGMTFLGAAVVTWRNQHLRMDVLVQACPPPVRAALRGLELALLAGLCGFVFALSASYAAQMFRLGRRSDTADVPMWIPHGAVALGFGLMALVAVWRGIQALASRRASPSIRNSTVVPETRS